MAGKFETRKGTAAARNVTIARKEARRVKYANAK